MRGGSPVAAGAVLLPCAALLSRGRGSGDGAGWRRGMLERREAGGVDRRIRRGADGCYGYFWVCERAVGGS